MGGNDVIITNGGHDQVQSGDGDDGIQIHGDLAITMGNVYFTNSKGEEVMVDKTFVFRRCSDGKLRLCVHKSSLPFGPVDK